MEKNVNRKLVKHVMKETSKDVRKPKAVRDGLVKEKKCKTCKVKPAFATITEKPVIHSILLDDSIKLKAKHIRNFPIFSQKVNYIEIPAMNKYLKPEKVRSSVSIDEVEIKIQAKEKKINKILDLFNAQKKIKIDISYHNGTKINSLGFIKEIFYNSDNEMTIKFAPDYLSVLPYEP